MIRLRQVRLAQGHAQWDYVQALDFITEVDQAMTARYDCWKQLDPDMVNTIRDYVAGYQSGQYTGGFTLPMFQSDLDKVQSFEACLSSPAPQDQSTPISAAPAPGAAPVPQASQPSVTPSGAPPTPSGTAPVPAGSAPSSASSSAPAAAAAPSRTLDYVLAGAGILLIATVVALSD